MKRKNLGRIVIAFLLAKLLTTLTLTLVGGATSPASVAEFIGYTLIFTPLFITVQRLLEVIRPESKSGNDDDPYTAALKEIEAEKAG